MTNPTILVTGATGTTGGALVQELARQGVATKALVRDLSKAEHLMSDAISLVEGDLNDPASLSRALEGVRAAYLNVVAGPEALTQIDNFLAAARTANVQHIVKLSGFHASDTSDSTIIRMHAEGDRRVRESGLAYTILRANSFFQNLLGQWDSITSTGRFYMPMGGARQSFIDVADIAAIAAKRLVQENVQSSSFELTGPEALSLSEVATALGDALGREVTYVPITSEAFFESLLDAGLPVEAAQAVQELFEVFATGVYAAPTTDVSKALDRPATSIKEFAKNATRSLAMA